jgi:GDP-mannose 6-dehydrogenase
MIPGTMRNTIIPILERESGRRCGEGLLVAYNPDFSGKHRGGRFLRAP